MVNDFQFYRPRKISTVNWPLKGCTENSCSDSLKFRHFSWLHSVHICVSTSGHSWERYLYAFKMLWPVLIFVSLNKCWGNVVS